MTDMGNDRQAHGFGIQRLCECRTADAPAIFEAGMLGNFLFASHWTVRKKLSHTRGKLLDIVAIQFVSSFGFALSTQLSCFAVR